MPIGNVVQRGNVVYVYDERGSVIFSLAGDGSRTGGVKTYTRDSVSIKRGDTTYIYDSKARLMTPQVD